MTALLTAHAAGTLSDDLADAYQELIYDCQGRDACAWVAQTTAKNHPKPVEAVLYAGLTDCGEEYRAAVEREESPDWVALEWYQMQIHHGYSKVPERLRQIVLRRLEQKGTSHLGEVARALRSVEEKVLLEFLDDISDKLTADSRAILSLALSGSHSKRAKELIKQACSREALSPEVVCMIHNSTGQTGLGLMSTGGLGLIGVGVPLANSEQTAKPAPPTIDSPVAKLDLGKLKSDLVQKRLIPPAAPPDADSESDNVTELLEEYGALHAFLPEPGGFPLEHDVLLVLLARKAGSQLEGIRFEQVVPAHEMVKVEGGLGELGAHRAEVRAACVSQSFDASMFGQ